jgi:hypothetical protein
MLNDEKKYEFKKKEKENQANPNEYLKSKLIFQTHNILNFKPEFNQNSQFPTNLMLMDEVKKKKNFKFPLFSIVSQCHMSFHKTHSTLT